MKVFHVQKELYIEEHKDFFKNTDTYIIQNMKKLKINSSESNLYIFNDYIIKIPKTKAYHNNLVRTVCIGKILNNISLLIPNFVKTVGTLYHNRQIMVVYENIVGDTFEKALEYLTFNEFINIFVQILFALEVAQRQYRFCHYDLHLKNIILKPIKNPYTYSVMLDTYRYDITAYKYIPTIIDFGYSCININGSKVFSSDFPHYGMMNFLVPCCDMYKLLYHSYIRSKGDLNRMIETVFLFYGKRDPYKILISSLEDIQKFSHTYLKDVPYSSIASLTPLDMIKWIYKNYNELSFKIYERDIYIGLIDKREITVSSESYLMTNYLNKISNRNRVIDNTMLDFDHEMIQGYKSISIPSVSKIKKSCEQILNESLGKNSIQLKCKFINSMKPYIDILYMIRELKIEASYRDFVKEFCNSNQYKTYCDLIFIYQKAERWNLTLKENLKQ